VTDHVLKTIDHYWYAVERGEKTFEVRRDDRGFQKGDVLVLRRLCPNKPHVEGRYETNSAGFESFVGYHDLRRRVTYVLTGGQLGVEPGYVVMGLTEE